MQQNLQRMQNLQNIYTPVREFKDGPFCSARRILKARHAVRSAALFNYT